MSGCGCDIDVIEKQQSRTLIILIAINGVMFIAELIAGILGDSTALTADSLDMLADASVYAIGMYAVGKSLSVKVSAAHLSGILQVILGLGVLLDIVRRSISGSEPEALFMLAVGAAALVANSICLALIHKHRKGDVNMRASWVFSKNDVIANIGVIISGLLVMTLDTHCPDLVIGLLIAAIVVRGGFQIIKEARIEKEKIIRENT